MARPAEKAIACQVLKEAGVHPDSIADLLNLSRSQVFRHLAAVKEAAEADPEHSAVDDLEVLIEPLTLDAEGKMKAGIARQIAAKLDRACASDKAQDSIAVPQLAKELRTLVAEIMDVSEGDREWVTDLFRT